MAATGIHPSGYALVTGGSGGIGLELARLLAEDGFGLVLVARDEGRLRRAAAGITERHPVRVRTLAADLARCGAAHEVGEFAGGLDAPVEVLVNNAGFATWGPFVDTPADVTRELLHLNVVALTDLTRLLLPGMIARGRGRILTVASTAAFQPGPLMAAYYASKAYALNFTEALAHELVGTGVTATTLCPGPTRTGFEQRAGMQASKLFRGRRVMDAAEVARVGYDAMLRGRPVVIAGRANRWLALLARLVPRAWAADTARRMQSRCEN